MLQVIEQYTSFGTWKETKYDFINSWRGGNGNGKKQQHINLA